MPVARADKRRAMNVRDGWEEDLGLDRRAPDTHLCAFIGASMKIAFAILLLLLATVVGLVEILSVVDPVGTKLADDGDPRGDPSTPWEVHAIYIGLIAALVGGAVLLIRRRKKD